MKRRPLLLAALAPACGFAQQAALAFPRDFGAHPRSHIEWWYATGHLLSGTRSFGFQVTFFRSRVAATQGMTSRFAAKQLVFAHAALTDVQGKRLLHDQRIAREGFDVAAFDESDTRVKLRDWTFRRVPGSRSASSGLRSPQPSPAVAWISEARSGDPSGDSSYHATIAARDFAFDLRLDETQPVLLQGDRGLSRKGPLPENASRYYSKPHLAVHGTISLEGKRLPVEGSAWLDHEWSDALLHPEAAGWDWIGMNLDDGSALTAFRVRRKSPAPGTQPTSDALALWDGGSFRPRGGSPYVFSRGELFFRPERIWKSPASQASYPVEWRVRTPADIYTVRAVLDNQELDSRASTGAIYWEGLSDLFDSNGRRVGSGYLEMTGYAQPLRL